MFNKNKGKGIKSLGIVCFTALVGLMLCGLSCCKEDGKASVNSPSLEGEKDSVESSSLEDEKAYAGSSSFGIVDNGKSVATIVIGEKATSVEEFAAKEMQKYIQKMSGASLPIVRDDEKKIEGNSILIGRDNTNKRIKKLSVKTKQLKEDGFIIKTVKNNLIISGINNRGTLFGVYDFLEDDLGCLFFQLWEVIPEKPTIKVGRISRAEEPDFKIRGRWACYPSVCDAQTKLKANWVKTFHTERWDNERYMGDKVDDSKSSDPRYHYYDKYVKLWKERGFILDFGTHTFAYFLAPERYFKEHPEYFSLIDGKRVSGRRNKSGYLFGTQICWSNPEAVKEVTKNVLEFIKKYPEVDKITVDPNDFDGFCECEKCMALETGKKSVWEGSKLSCSRGYALFLNKIAEEVHKYYPEKRFPMSVYRVVLDPPDNVKISKSVIPIVFIANRDFSRPINDPSGKGTRFIRGGYKKVIEGWTKLSSNVVLGEYYYGSARSILMGIPAWSILFKEYPYFKKIGVTGIVSPDDGPFSVFLTSYVGYRLGWDCNDEVLNNFCVKSFGKAAEPIRRYLDIIGKMMERQEPGLLNTNPDMIKMWSREKKAVQSAKDCLKEAKTVVKGNKKILGRIRFVERDLYFSSLIGAGYRLYLKGQEAIKDKDYKKASELFQLSIDNYRKAPSFHHYSPKDAQKYLEKNYINQSMQSLKLSEVLMKVGKSKREEPNIIINSLAEKTKKYPGTKKIAVYNSDIDGGKCYGKTAILSTLINAEGFQPEFITDLSLKNLLQYDCLIFPGVNKLGKSQINSSWVENIRKYVMKHGKGAMFQHDSCGYAPHNWILGDTTVFPEVCKGVKVKTGTRPGTEGNKEGKRMIVNAIHSLTEGYKVGDERSHTYWDHMALIKEKKGEVILTDKNKDPVVIAGKIGKGKVVFDGTTPSDEKTGEVEIITGIEKDILINSINWFCESSRRMNEKDSRQ